MKNFLIHVSIAMLVVVVSVFSFTTFSFSEDAKKHEYIGVDKCKPCHMKGDNSPYKQWQGSEHAKAFEKLASEKALEYGKAKGIDKPQESPACLKCHVTGYGETEKIDKTKGVQCESCHGAGNDYKSMSMMKKKDKAMENGLIVPDEKVCVKCHNQESPGFKGFDFKAYFEKIKHSKK